MDERRGLTLRDGVQLSVMLVCLALALGIGVATWVGYRFYTDRYAVSTDDAGVARARVVAATLYGRSDLRVSQLSGTVQGTGQTTRLWGWLPASQVVKAPFEVDYFVDLGRLRAADFEMSGDGRRIVVTVPEVTVGRPNVDLAQATLNDVRGVFVSRGTMIEMARKVAGSAQAVAGERARSPENIAKARGYARTAIERLFTGAFRAARLDTQVEVRFAGERPDPSERWDVSRSIAEVLANAS